MLIAMAITLVMMAAVVTLFANVSNSVRNRRAVIELNGQLRHVRNMLQRDLEGATCQALPWQRPESNQGYIEIIEGPYREGYASRLLDVDQQTGENWPPTRANPEIDHATSILPSSNLPVTTPSDAVPFGQWVTDGGGLGDYDDILMLTVRNEHEPFIGRVPSGVRLNETRANTFDNWEHQSLASPLAEVVWYSVENPGLHLEAGSLTDPTGGFFGEPGMRTIYRRALLIAPWVNPYRYVDDDGVIDDTFRLAGEADEFLAHPGLVRILSEEVERTMVPEALAALVAFQERYDLSVRLEFDPLLPSEGRWKIVANTLSDLTKRENRYEHHFYHYEGPREYPFAVVSVGAAYENDDVEFAVDRELGEPDDDAAATANLQSDGFTGIAQFVANYTADLPANLSDDRRYPARPFACVAAESVRLATARAMLDDEGHVLRVVHGLVPLSGARRGEDVMLSDALAFDLRVYDPGAPLYGVLEDPDSPLAAAAPEYAAIVDPNDPSWATIYDLDVPTIDDFVDDDFDNTNQYRSVGQGAFVNLGYGFKRLIPRQFRVSAAAGTTPWFFGSPSEIENTRFRYQSDPTPPGFVRNPGALSDVYDNPLAPGCAVYDTWSFHYENNGIDEDDDGLIDEGTNGLDDPGHYANPSSPPPTVTDVRLGVDDAGERETAPPYDKPLRAVQVLLRVYERDSRQIRQVRVNQHFLPE